MNTKQQTTRYLRVKNYIMEGIRQQRWSSGDQVPSENQLVNLCQVSRMTARRALDELNTEGLLFRIRGKGSFVAHDKQQSSMVEVKNIKQDIIDRGQDYSAKVVRLVALPHEGISNQFKLATPTLHFSEIVHMGNETPVQLEQRWVNPHSIDGYLEQDFSLQTPNEYLNRKAPLTRFSHQVEAVLPNDRTASLLGLETGEPTLLLTRVTFSEDQFVSVAKLSHPGSRYRLGADITVEM